MSESDRHATQCDQRVRLPHRVHRGELRGEPRGDSVECDPDSESLLVNYNTCLQIREGLSIHFEWQSGFAFRGDARSLI